MSETARSVQEIAPWLAPLRDDIVATKDSGLLACFELTGLDLDGAPSGTLAQLNSALDNAMAAWRGQPVNLWWQLRRERAAEYPDGEFHDPVAHMIDEEQRATFTTTGGFINRCFVSVMWMPKRGIETAMERIGAYAADGKSLPRATWLGLRSLLSTRETFAWRAADLDQTLETFNGLLEQFEGALSILGARRLAGEDLMGLLWATANPGCAVVPKAMPRDGRLLDGLFPERTVSTSRDLLVFDPNTRDELYLSALSLKTFPDDFEAGALDGLLSAPCEGIYTAAFRVADNATTGRRVSSARMLANMTKFPLKAIIASTFKGGQVDESMADPAKQEAIDNATEALGEVSSGRLYFGWLNTTLCFYGPDAAEVTRWTDEAVRAMRGSSFMGAVREQVHLLSAWSVTLPGSWDECRRWYFMSAVNYADLVPVTSAGEGERTNEHYTSQFGSPQPALTVFPTDIATPYYFNFNVGQTGHAFVVGPTRSGKSTVMNFLLSQFQKYPNARTIIFDRDRSCRIPTLLQGGQHIDVRPDGAVKMNPLKLATPDGEHWPFLARWVEGLIEARGYKVTAEDTKNVWEAIESVATDADPQNRRLAAVRNLLKQHLQVQLDPWIEGGQYGTYFDNVDDSFALSNFTCIEMGPVMQQPTLSGVLMDYLFYQVSLAVKQRPDEPPHPTILYVEEASFMLQNPKFALNLVDWLKTFAKLTGNVILTTQSPEDFSDTDVARVFAALRDNIMTRIYLPNPNATSAGLRKLYTSVFQLTEEQVDRIAMAQPQREYFVVKPHFARMVNVRLTKAQVNALRSDDLAQRTFDTFWNGGNGEPGWEQRYLDAMALRG